MERLDFKKMLETLTDNQLTSVKEMIDEIFIERQDMSKVVKVDVLEASVFDLKHIFKSHSWRFNLEKRGINTIRQLINLRRDELLRWSMIGIKRIEEVQGELKDRYQIDVWLK